MSIEFVISDWRAWYAGVSEPADWHRWHSGELELQEDTLADVSFLPAMLRRRLSPLSKAVFNSAYPLLQQRDIPLLCCSVHGEAKRTYSLLQGVAAEEDLSPTAFGLSVHNAIAGQLSIANKVRSPALALAGGDYPLLAGLMEANGILREGAKEILLIFCEEPLPEMYHPSTQSPSGVCATALLLTLPVEGSKGSGVTLVNSSSVRLKTAFEEADYQLPLLSALIKNSGKVPVAKGWELLINAN
ncbi:beta-ketoacyl synthase chain length factor [Microbulbifer variabilis]|uniref:Beta-ketoacyl synthase chain length factor n=1 Tax=Microbulbifer variabilis TaxID=266805 RepID=A0ABY4VBN4_9GAMM|nr:beta-ketoacyl synthase chain length factor [Microbulbifer variabilis]USD21629.1 beta-ketoacyl synthase chain length factor [Microbulbifer variabilis]